MPLLDDYERHLTRLGRAASTIDRYLTDLRAFTEWLEGTGYDEVTPVMIEEFLDGRRITTSRTRYRWLSELHTFYEWAVIYEHLPTDPTLRIIRPSVSRLLPRPIDEEHLAWALHVAGPMMRAWLVLAAFSGLRCAEIAGLQRADIQPGQLRVLGKGNKERVLPMHPMVKEALGDLDLARTGPAFRQRNGRPFSAKAVSNEVSSFLRALGFDETAHQGRHRFGTVAYRAKKDLRAVQELMGHAYSSTTDIYTKVTADDLAETVNAIPDVDAGRGVA